MGTKACFFIQDLCGKCLMVVMMKKTLWVLALMTALLTVSACSGGFTDAVDTGTLMKQDKSYGWGKLSWGMDIASVENTLGYKLSQNANEGLEIDDDTDYRKDPYEGTAVFKETKASSLSGAKGIVCYTFDAGALKDVWITCYPEDNSQEQLTEAFVKAQTELKTLYGEPDETQDSDSYGLFSVNSHWVGSDINKKKTGLNCSVLYTDAEQTEIHSITLAVSTYGGEG